MNIFGCLTSDDNDSPFTSLVNIIWSLLRIMLDILNSYPSVLKMKQCYIKTLRA